jgi:regulator of protease activity HflC (stomatin/prohibitin superfamily)
MYPVVTVPQAHCVLVERFGKYSSTKGAGLSLVIPFIDSVKSLPEWQGTAIKESVYIELTQQQTDTLPRQCHTKDNVPVTANVSIYWRITDPHRAVYEVDVLPRSIKDTAQNALRAHIGSMVLDQVFAERAKINEAISNQLTTVTSSWGVSLERVEIQELRTEGDVEAAMLQQMEAERKRRAFISEASGKAEAAITVAEAEKKAAVLRAEGEALAMAKTAEAENFYLKRLREQVGDSEAANILMAQKYIAGFSAISSNPADKIYLPNSMQGIHVFGETRTPTPPPSTR